MANWTPTPGYFPVAGWGGNPPPEPCECGGEDFTYRRSLYGYGTGAGQFSAATEVGSLVVLWIGSPGVQGEVTSPGSPWFLQQSISGPYQETIRAFSRPGDGSDCPFAFIDNEYGEGNSMFVMLEFPIGCSAVFNGGNANVGSGSTPEISYPSPNVGPVISKPFGWFYSRNGGNDVTADAPFYPAGSTAFANMVSADGFYCSGVLIDGNQQVNVNAPTVGFTASGTGISGGALIALVQSPVS